MCLELHWTEYLKALGPTIIAMIVVYIAYQQWRVNQASLREKLFERRFLVFRQTQTFLSDIQGYRRITNSNLENFNNAHQVARFLFDKELADYLFDIRSHALNVQMYASELQDLEAGDHRTGLVKNKNVELIWLMDQRNIIFDKFEPYLGFKDHK